MSSDNIFIPWLRSPFTCHWKHPGFLMIHASPLRHTSVLLHCSICTFYLPKIFSYQSFEEDFWESSVISCWSTRLFGSFLIVKSLVLILYELTQASSWKQRQIGWRFSPESAELPHSCNHLNQQFSFSSVLYVFPWHVNSWNVDATLSLKESFHKEPSNWENFLLQLKLLLQRLDPMLATTINKKRKLEALSSHCLLSSGGDQSTLSWLRVEAGGFTVWLVCLLLQVC